MISPAYMDNSLLGELIREKSSEIHEDQPGYWKFEYSELLIFVLTDESHDRMRIMTPIVPVEKVEDDQWFPMMSANFDRALDARYCVNGDNLWSAFIHPLRELSRKQFHSGLDQVVTLAKNFGTSYSSGDLVFGG